MIAVPDTSQKAVYDAEIEPNLRPGQLLMFAHGFNIRFGRIQPPARRSTSGWSRPRARATCCAACTSRAAACRRCSRSSRTRRGTARARTLAYARGHRLDPRRRPRDDVQGGDRDRPVRRAGAAVRRRLGARQGGVRDARRGRLPARARVLRDDARAQAHRRPDVPRRPQLHALQRQRHRRVRRLRLRPAGDRGRQGRDEGRPDRHPERRRSRRAGSRSRTPAARSSAGCASRTGTTRSSRSAPTSGRRCRSSTRSSSRPARRRPSRSAAHRRGRAAR